MAGAGQGRWMRRRIVGAAAVVALLVAGTTAVALAARSSSESPVTAAAGPPPSTEPPPSTSTTRATTTTTAPVCDRRPGLDAAGAALPAPWARRVFAALSDPAWSGVERSISIWVEGHGEIVAVEPDLALLPASNEKVLTAVGARLLLDPAARFHTEVRISGADLVLVAGGDPSLRTTGPHSLGALAAQVRAAGIAEVATVQVDASRFEPATTARGWQDWQVPTYVGPMSALVVDDNRSRSDAAYLADPALGNGEAFVAALRSAGVRVGGGVTHGVSAPSMPVVAALDSPTVAELSHDMLLRSDNEIAESLVRTIGDGRTELGTDRIAAALAPWCLHLGGDVADGSGLSREDRRSARDWRRVLQVALEQPWATDVWSGLPVAGRTGTLSGRLTGPATNGNVTAKTGTIIGGSALSGYATTADGRRVVFSIVVNGEPAAAARAVGAIDRLVAAVVGS